MRYKLTHRIGSLAKMQEMSVCGTRMFDRKQDFLKVISETEPIVTFFKKVYEKAKAIGHL